MSQLSDFNFKNGLIGRAIQGWGYKTGLIKRLLPLSKKYNVHIGVPRGVIGELAKDYNQTMKLFSRLTPRQKANFTKTLQEFYNLFPNATPRYKVEYITSLLYHFLEGGEELKEGNIFPEQFKEELRSHTQKNPYKRIYPEEAKAIQDKEEDKKVKDNKSNSKPNYPQEYKINLGDTLYKIAKRFNTTVELLAKDNNIKDINRIIAGHKLIINPVKKTLKKPKQLKQNSTIKPPSRDDVISEMPVMEINDNLKVRNLSTALAYDLLPSESPQDYEEGIITTILRGKGGKLTKYLLGGEFQPLTRLLLQDKYQNIARAYFNLAPTIPNLYRGMEAYLTSLGILTPPSSDTGLITGTAPIGGRGVVSGSRIWNATRSYKPTRAAIKNKSLGRTNGWRKNKPVTDLVKVNKKKTTKSIVPKQTTAIVQVLPTAVVKPTTPFTMTPPLLSIPLSYSDIVLLPTNNGGQYGGGDFAGGGVGGDFGLNPSNNYRDNRFLGIALPYEKRNFEEAYAEARRKGLKTFEFNGKTYSTAYDTSNDPERAKKHKEAARSRKEYGVIGIGKWEK